MSGDDAPFESSSEAGDDSADCSPTVVTVGAATVDRQYLVSNLPEPDGGAFAHEVTDQFGGVGANVAVGCARLGRAAGIVSRIGTDEIGDSVMRNLEDGPLGLRRVRREDDISTHCVVLRDGDGKRSIVTAGNSVARLRLEPEDRPYLEDADIVFVTAYVHNEVHRQLSLWAADPSFPPVVFDLSGPLEELEGRGATRESIDRWVERASLFVVSDVAASSYLRATGREAAVALAERGVERAAVTSGDEGAVLVDTPGERSGERSDERSDESPDTPLDDRLVDVPAFSVDVTDETGAGDAYVAGLIHAWLLGEDAAAEAGEFAAATAALNCTAAGARGNLPTEDDVREFLDDV
jgi:ribokinase/sulfofructose kinase